MNIHTQFCNVYFDKEKRERERERELKIEDIFLYFLAYLIIIYLDCHYYLFALLHIFLLHRRKKKVDVK